MKLRGQTDNQRRRIAQVRGLRIRAALLVLTDHVSIDRWNYREKINEAVDLLGGSETIDETIDGDLVIGGVLQIEPHERRVDAKRSATSPDGRRPTRTALRGARQEDSDGEFS